MIARRHDFYNMAVNSGYLQTIAIFKLLQLVQRNCSSRTVLLRALKLLILDDQIGLISQLVDITNNLNTIAPREMHRITNQEYHHNAQYSAA